MKIMSQENEMDEKSIWKSEEKFDEIFGKIRALARKHITEMAETSEGRERLRVMREAQGTVIPIMTKEDMGFPRKTSDETVTEK